MKIHYTGSVDPEWQKQFTFDPACGHSLSELLTIPPASEVDDFDSFWEQSWHQNKEQPLSYSLEKQGENSKWQIDLMRYKSWDDFETAAWLIRPRDQEVQALMVAGHGYGGRETYEPGLPIHHTAVLFPVARGFHRSASQRYPENDAGRHVLHGIESKEDYIIRGCVAEIWTAADILAELYPEAAENMAYYGVSFGAGLGALALPWTKAFRSAVLIVPTFGEQQMRLKYPSLGSAAALQTHARCASDPMTVLAYYDASVAATKIKIPVFAAPALFDPAVCPPGQFAISNNLQSKELFIQSAGHFHFKGILEEKRLLNRCIADFLEK